MAISTAAISSALPGAERKRISPKAPPMATPAPMLPLTKQITEPTTSGSRAMTRKKRLDERTEKLMIQA